MDGGFFPAAIGKDRLRIQPVDATH